MRKNKIILVLLLFSFSPLFATHWDLEFWQYFNAKNWSCGPFSLYTTGEVRTHYDFSKFYYYRVTENFAYQALSNLDLESHFSFIRNKSRGRNFFSSNFRLEFEVNPHVTFSNGITVTWRNRIEFLKKEYIPKVMTILRHRTDITFPIEGWGIIKQFQCSEEVYYDCNTHKFTQSRFIPIRFSFVDRSKFSVDLFFMIRNFLNTQKWYRSFVFGSEWDF